MKYWIIKSNPKENDLKKMLEYGTQQIWSTDKNIPSEMKNGDMLFICVNSGVKFGRNS